MIRLPMASGVVGITGVCLETPDYWLRWNLANFLPRPALYLDPPRSPPLE
jgi:hypothetical protein